MSQLPWAICSMAEGSTMHSLNVCRMNNESFLETCPESVSAFSLCPLSGDHRKVQGLY